jgi:hypothetical protein
MKFEFIKEWIFIGIMIFFIFIFIWNFESIESMENEDENTHVLKSMHSPDNQLGNYLSCYFFNMGQAFLNGKNFKTDIPYSNVFTNYLPTDVKFDQSVQQKMISVGITNESIQEDLNQLGGWCWSAWIVMTKQMDTFWTIMKPTINRILKDAFQKANLEKTVDAPVIHYRCSDSPINKLEYYHFQKYDFFKDSLEKIQDKTKTKYNKVYVCYCNSHGAPIENQESCDKYFKYLIHYLESLGYEVVIKCQSVSDDFATMFYAPGLISTSSSFSFFAGYFSDGVFITSIYDEPKDRVCKDCADWSNSGYTLKHSEVDDYHDTDTVINKLQ